jgi:hypothetical protein
MHMVTSNHVYADELTVHGEHDVKTGMQQDWKRESEAWSAPARRKIAPGPARQAGHTHVAQHARSYLKSDTNAASTAVCQQHASPGRGRCCHHPPGLLM